MTGNLWIAVLLNLEIKLEPHIWHESIVALTRECGEWEPWRLLSICAIAWLKYSPFSFGYVLYFNHYRYFLKLNTQNSMIFLEIMLTIFNDVSRMPTRGRKSWHIEKYNYRSEFLRNTEWQCKKHIQCRYKPIFSAQLGTLTFTHRATRSNKNESISNPIGEIYIC